jgi:hypothetical protein
MKAQVLEGKICYTKCRLFMKSKFTKYRKEIPCLLAGTRTKYKISLQAGMLPPKCETDAIFLCEHASYISDWIH